MWPLIEQRSERTQFVPAFQREKRLLKKNYSALFGVIKPLEFYIVITKPKTSARAYMK
jgi:hypothetical protein